ncbi:MAG: GTPase Era [Armatimonadota bacterium]
MEFIAAASKNSGPTRCGFATIVGKPNVGKSTLINALMGIKVAPTTNRPQTTRRSVRGILTDGTQQVIFVDTPGWSRPTDLLGSYMRGQITESIQDVDALLWVVDLRKPPGEEDAAVAQMLQPMSENVLIVGNKLDAAKRPIDAEAAYRALMPETVPYIAISALKDAKSVNRLKALVFGLMPEGPLLYPDDMKSDQSRTEWAEDIIRERLMTNLDDELPYSVAVKIAEWTERENGMQFIDAVVIVERETHKGIVVGKKGQMLKVVGSEAREQLEIMLNTRIFLQLEVMVMDDWRRDERSMGKLGYGLSE